MKIRLPETQLPGKTREIAPSVAELYQELQKAQRALARMAALIEQVASTLPPDD
jgi:hypothetical protein